MADRVRQSATDALKAGQTVTAKHAFFRQQLLPLGVVLGAVRRPTVQHVF